MVSSSAPNGRTVRASLLGISRLGLLAGLLVSACGGSEDATAPIGQGGSSSTGTGGTPSAGGVVSNPTGGSIGSGGSSAKGGNPSTGGIVSTSTGGTVSTGTGGTVSTSAGGTTSTGGSPSSGGMKSGTGGSISATGGAGGSGGKASGGTTAAGGTTNTGGKATGGSMATGGTPSTGNATVCNFSSGLNIAWVSFARDVPNPDIATFTTIFKNTFSAGGRVVRWWFHTNGSLTPGYDASGKAQKLPQSHIDGVKAILAAAQGAGVRVNISLWSFDMFQSNAGAAYANNRLLLENDENRQAYIDNYLTPLVVALKGNPGLYSYEIFNEPEGMGPKGWATYRTTEAFIQKTVNWFAAAIHTADPAALVTNGAQTFDYCSNVSGKTNYYSDAALRAAGGKNNGTLDYYEVHYYAANTASNSPFTRPASYWGLDKKLVIGEFFAEATDGVAQASLYTNLYTSGYNGAWAWSYNADQKWPTMQAPMQAVASAHADVTTCP
jgi:hypothetical protein